MSENLTILSGDVRQTLAQLPAGSVHVGITSPPYYLLRGYLAALHALKRFELGGEDSPELYLSNLVGVFREFRRVLRDDGCLFVNLGDTYIDGVRMMMPERFAMAMQADGWKLRDCIIWHKPAPMPASINGVRWERCRVKVKASKRVIVGTFHAESSAKPHGARDGADFASIADWSDCPGCSKCRAADGWVLRRGSWRTTTAHEPIFMFTKSDKYFCDAFAAREPAATSTLERNKYSRILDDADEQFAIKHDHETTGLTRNPRSVWTIASGGSSLKHYAMFPIEIPSRLIEVATSAHGVCAACGAQWARKVEMSRTHESGSGRSGNAPAGKNGDGLQGGGNTGDIRNGPCVEVDCVGWLPTCDCNTDRIPATVCDPFGGSGTTAEAAISMGRRAVLCELSPEYVALIRTRLARAFPLLVRESA